MLIFLYLLSIIRLDSIVIIIIINNIEKLFVMGIANETMDISGSDCYPILHFAIYRGHRY